MHIIIPTWHQNRNKFVRGKHANASQLLVIQMAHPASMVREVFAGKTKQPRRFHELDVRNSPDVTCPVYTRD